MTADGQIPGDAVMAQRRRREAALEREFISALRADPEMLIGIARDAALANERAVGHAKDERVALDPATDPKVAARLTAAAERRRQARAKALDAAADEA